jgi:predicted DNA binding CopG/RHH family protein
MSYDKKMPIITARVPENMKTALSLLAASKDMPLQKLVREALTEKLQREAAKSSLT